MVGGHHMVVGVYGRCVRLLVVVVPNQETVVERAQIQYLDMAGVNVLDQTQKTYLRNVIPLLAQVSIAKFRLFVS